MIKAHPALGVAIETNQGAAVDQLLQSQVTVYPMQPKAAERYRDRHVPSGSKTDQADAWCFADALRVDGQHWRPLAPEDPLTEELRLLCRDEVELITQRTALVNQIQQALCEYYPAALEAFDDWTGAFTWDFVVAFPRRRNWSKRANENGKSSCTATNCGDRGRPKNAWKYLRGPISSVAPWR